jgi:hypothetical protein
MLSWLLGKHLARRRCPILVHFFVVSGFPSVINTLVEFSFAKQKLAECHVLLLLIQLGSESFFGNLSNFEISVVIFTQKRSESGLLFLCSSDLFLLCFIVNSGLILLADGVSWGFFRCLSTRLIVLLRWLYLIQLSVLIDLGVVRLLLDLLLRIRRQRWILLLTIIAVVVSFIYELILLRLTNGKRKAKEN